MPQISVSRLALLALILVSVFLTELGSARLWDRDEPRNSRASHEMLERGDWIVPTFNGELRTHKPVLLYWMQMTSYLAIGESEFAARLPSALSAIFSALIIALLASRLTGCPTGINRDGFWAAAALGTCMFFVMAGRAATPDACLILFSTAGIAALVIAALSPSQPYSSGRVTKARWLPAMLGYLLLGLAVLAKGPVGIILPLAVVHAWWMICNRVQSTAPETASREQPLAQRARHLLYEAWYTFNPLSCLRSVFALRTIPGVLLCLLAATPWYVAVGMQTNGDFLRGFFLEHNVGRAMNSMEGHGGSIFFYPVAFLVGTFPWSLWLVAIILWCRKAAGESVMHRQLIVLSGVWVAVYMSAFTIASTKLPSYITPCYAGAALVIGGYLRQFESTWSLPAVNWRRAGYAITIVVGCGICGVILWMSSNESMPLLRQACLAGVAIAGVGIVAFVLDSETQLRRKSQPSSGEHKRTRVALVPAVWLAGAAFFQVTLFGFGAKSVDKYRDDLRMLSAVQEVAPGQHWLTVGGLEPSWVHYLGHEIVEVRSSPTQQETWEQVAAFLNSYPDGRVIAVGDEAEAELQNFIASSGEAELQSLASTRRFLRPGSMTVYSRQTNIGAIAGFEPHAIRSPASETLPMPTDALDSKRVRAQPVSHQRVLSGPMSESVPQEFPNPIRVDDESHSSAVKPWDGNPLRRPIER